MLLPRQERKRQVGLLDQRKKFYGPRSSQLPECERPARTKLVENHNETQNSGNCKTQRNGKCLPRQRDLCDEPAQPDMMQNDRTVNTALPPNRASKKQSAQEKKKGASEMKPSDARILAGRVEH